MGCRPQRSPQGHVLCDSGSPPSYWRDQSKGAGAAGGIEAVVNTALASVCSALTGQTNYGSAKSGR